MSVADDIEDYVFGEKAMTFEEARLNDVTVYTMTQQGCTPREIVAKLVEEKRSLLRRISELSAIAPRKISHNGQTYVWHCPDEFVPGEML